MMMNDDDDEKRRRRRLEEKWCIDSDSQTKISWSLRANKYLGWGRFDYLFVNQSKTNLDFFPCKESRLLKNHLNLLESLCHSTALQSNGFTSCIYINYSWILRQLNDESYVARVTTNSEHHGTTRKLRTSLERGNKKNTQLKDRTRSNRSALSLLYCYYSSIFRWSSSVRNLQR